MSQLYNFSKRPKDSPTPAIYNRSEHLCLVLHLLSKEYSHFLRNLKLHELDEKKIVAHRRRVLATEERLRYCLHSLTVLGDHRNPGTTKIEGYVGHLMDLTKKLKEEADDWPEKKTRLQNKEAAEKNPKTAIEARDEARASTELAKNVWRLTLLGFIFIPLNFVTSAFAMHLRLLGFQENDGGLPTWPFFAVAVLIELLVLFLFGAMSGYINKTWRGCRHVVSCIWVKLGRACGTGTPLEDPTSEVHSVSDQV